MMHTALNAMAGDKHSFDFDNPEGLIVKVHDLAKGLLWDDLEKNMMQLGEKASGHAEGNEVRGLLKRGKMLRSLEKLLLKRFGEASSVL